MENRYQYETSPRKEKIEQKREKKHKNIEIVKEQPKQEVKISAEQKKRHKKLTLLVVIAFALLLTISYRNTKINEEFKEMQSKKTELAALKKENEQLQVTIENSLNLSNIEKQAKEKLGMQKLTSKQTVYVTLPKKDYVETESEKVVKTETKTWWQNLADKILKF